jgi:glyoxylase-like metal-dependent hydrolase (beta-lactamase superfamily II)
VRVIVTPVTLFQQNCSLVWCENTRRGAIVDPGGDTDPVLATAVREGVTIEKLLITHAHIDHAGATAALARELGDRFVREYQRGLSALVAEGNASGAAPSGGSAPNPDTATAANPVH